MELGTWGEWFGATATAAATVVALYFGARNGELAAERARARTQIRNLAGEDVLTFDRLKVGLSRSRLREVARGHLDDDERVAKYVAAASNLSWVRRPLAVALLRYIYGETHLRLARLDPIRVPGQSMTRLLTALVIEDESAVGDYRTTTRLHRALLHDAPVRLRRSVRRAFRALERI